MKYGFEWPSGLGGEVDRVAYIGIFLSIIITSTPYLTFKISTEENAVLIYMDSFSCSHIW